jgi:acetolactate synthase-1/2/3 large subunit
MDSTPIVCLTGQVPTTGIGSDFFQEADISGITYPIVKHSYLVKKPEKLARLLANAFYISTSGRPGPTLVDMPKDVLNGEYEITPHNTTENYKPDIKGYKPKVFGNSKQVSLAAKKILKAKRPVLYVGGGIIKAGASKLVQELAEKYNLPVTTTLMGIGAIAHEHPLNLGMLGMHGTAYANYSIYNSDLLIAVGVRFDDRVTGKLETFAPDAETIHIDIDPAEIGKNREMSCEADVPIVGDAKVVLKDLISELDNRKPNSKDWLDKIDEWKKEYPLDRDPISQEHISPQFIFKTIADMLNDKVIYSTDVGQHQMFTAQYAKIDKPRQWLTSGGAGTMGYGLPAAMGGAAALADSEGTENDRSDETIVNITGDGSFQMCIQELGTLKAYDLKVANVIFNNNNLGMVRQWQELFYEGNYSHVDLKHGTPNFSKLAEAFGLRGYRAQTRAEFTEMIGNCFADTQATVLDCDMAYDMNVWPIVPAGASNIEMMGIKNNTFKQSEPEFDTSDYV